MRKKQTNKDKISTRENLLNVGFVIKFLYKANKKLYLVRIPILFLQTASSVVSVYFLRIILNEITGGGSLTTVLLFSFGLAVANLAVALTNKFVLMYDRKQLERTSYNIKLMLGKAIAKMPYSDVEDPRMKDFISLAQSTDSFSSIIEYATGCLGAVINSLTYAAIVLTVQPLILLLIAATITAQIIIYKIRLNRSYKWRTTQAPLYRKMGYFFDALSNIKYGKELRIYDLKDYFTDKGTKQFKDDCLPIIKKNSFEGNMLYYSVEILKVLQKLVIYILLAVKVVFSGITIGDFTLYLTSTETMSDSLAGMVGCFSNLMTCGLFAREFRYCIKLSEKKQKDFGKSFVANNSTLSIEFKNVSFKYPNTDRMVLKNISFKINAGEKLSLVGVNGSGKSTIVKLICRFYEPTEGEIFIGGVCTKNLSSDEYARLLGVVFQDFKLFSFSVGENIAMDTEADEEKLDFSIINSGLEDKIKGLPLGIKTSVYKEFDENGVEFSGGEGQKLAIARAVYKDAPLIILDEPTAALDPIAEYEVYKHFDTLSDGKTAIYISHRLSSTRFTDKIAVLSDGVLREFGSHKELMNIAGGLYNEMFEMQAQYYR